MKMGGRGGAALTELCGILLLLTGSCHCGGEDAAGQTRTGSKGSGSDSVFPFTCPHPVRCAS